MEQQIEIAHRLSISVVARPAIPVVLRITNLVFLKKKIKKGLSKVLARIKVVRFLMISSNLLLGNLIFITKKAFVVKFSEVHARIFVVKLLMISVKLCSRILDI